MNLKTRPQRRSFRPVSRPVPFGVRLALLVIVLLAPWAAGWNPNGGEIHEPGGQWQVTHLSQAAGNVCDPQGITDQICLEWCEDNPGGGQAIPTGFLCCKSSSQIGSRNEACGSLL